jgi:hypothetical protein
MSSDRTPGQKAAFTRKRRAAAAKAVTTRKRLNAFDKVRANEAASKEALRAYCEANKWRVGFFEGKTGAPRTGIIDAIIFRISKQNADTLELRLVQLKGGHAGASGAEIARLKKASEAVAVDWMIAAFDGESLHLLSDDPGPTMEKRRTNTSRRARAKKQIAAIEAALMQPVVSTKPL